MAELRSKSYYCALTSDNEELMNGKLFRREIEYYLFGILGCTFRYYNGDEKKIADIPVQMSDDMPHGVIIEGIPCASYILVLFVLSR